MQGSEAGNSISNWSETLEAGKQELTAKAHAAMLTTLQRFALFEALLQYHPQSSAEVDLYSYLQEDAASRWSNEKTRFQAVAECEASCRSRDVLLSFLNRTDRHSVSSAIAAAQLRTERPDSLEAVARAKQRYSEAFASMLERLADQFVQTGDQPKAAEIEDLSTKILQDSAEELNHVPGYLSATDIGLDLPREIGNHINLLIDQAENVLGVDRRVLANRTNEEYRALKTLAQSVRPGFTD
jgi:hypothetical protein